MTEFCKFILTLDMVSWLKLMGTFFILALLMAGIVEEIGAKWGKSPEDGAKESVKRMFGKIND